jgi:hypothetical protein
LPPHLNGIPDAGALIAGKETPPPRPATTPQSPIHIGAIPSELRERKQWVVWRHENRAGERKKVPYDPRTGKAASTTEPATWGSFEDALNALRRSGHSVPRTTTASIGASLATAAVTDSAVVTDHTAARLDGLAIIAGGLVGFDLYHCVDGWLVGYYTRRETNDPPAADVGNVGDDAVLAFTRECDAREAVR